MDNYSYIVEALNKNHEKKSFVCGVDALNHYLMKQASQDARRHIAAIYVLTKTSSNIIIGYYTLSATSIDLSALPSKICKKLPRYPTLPATLLGRLAIDKENQGKKLGELLLIDALKRSLAISRKIASMAVIVDAKNDKAIQFYTRYGFIQFSQNKNRLFIPTNTIKQLPN